MTAAMLIDCLRNGDGENTTHAQIRTSRISTLECSCLQLRIPLPLVHPQAVRNRHPPRLRCSYAYSLGRRRPCQVATVSFVRALCLNWDEPIYSPSEPSCSGQEAI